MRRHVLLWIALAAAPAARGEDAPPPAAAAAAAAAPPSTRPPVTRRAFPGDRGPVVLATGGTLIGRVVTLSPTEEVVELVSGARVKLAPGTILGFADPPPPAPDASEQELLFRDGRVVRGVLVAEDGASITIRDASGETRVLRSDLRDRRARPHWGFGDPLEDPARSRLLASPTAFRVERGEVALSVSGPAQPAVVAGLGFGLALRASGLVPSLYGSHEGASGTVALQAGASPLPRVRVAGGVLGAFERSGAAAFAFAAATYGTPDAHVTAYAGPPAVNASGLGVRSDTVLAVGGSLRVHRYASVVAEAWRPLGVSDTDVVTGLAGRLYAAGFALDLGAVAAFGGELHAAPWFGVSWTGAPAKLF